MTKLSAILTASALLPILLIGPADRDAAQVGDRITQEQIRLLKQEMQLAERGAKLSMYSATLAGCARGERIALDDGETLISVECTPVYVRLAK